LNVSVAGGIMVYEAVRQRRNWGYLRAELGEMPKSARLLCI